MLLSDARDLAPPAAPAVIKLCAFSPSLLACRRLSPTAIPPVDSIHVLPRQAFRLKPRRQTIMARQISPFTRLGIDIAAFLVLALIDRLRESGLGLGHAAPVAPVSPASGAGEAAD
jgi:hypothetical protein